MGDAGVGGQDFSANVLESSRFITRCKCLPTETLHGKLAISQAEVWAREVRTVSQTPMSKGVQSET